MNAAFYHKNLPYNFTFFCKVKALFVEDSLLFFLAETGETLSFSAWVDELLKTEVDPKEELSANDVGLLGLAPLGQDERDADVVSGLDSFKFEDVFDVVVLDEELLDEDEAAEDAQQQSSSSSLQDEEFVEEEEYE